MIAGTMPHPSASGVRGLQYASKRVDRSLRLQSRNRGPATQLLRAATDALIALAGALLADGLAAVALGHPEMWRRAEADPIGIAVDLRLVRADRSGITVALRVVRRTIVTNSPVTVRPLIIQ
jgi:hypothetical protein